MKQAAQGSFVTTRPVAILMVFLATVVFGYLSFGRLPVTLMPELSYPTLTVRTEYPGSAPEEVENDISRPIEEALGVIGGLKQVRSISRAGISDVILEFAWDSEMSDATQDVLEKLDLVFLPEEAKRPLILHYDPSLDPVMELSLSGEGRRFEGESGLRRLRRLAELQIKKELEPIKGVAAVRIRGGLEEEIHLLLDEKALRRSGIPIQMVIDRLAQENINVAGGTLQEGRTEYLVRTLNEYESLQQISETIIATLDGRHVRVRDLGEVVNSHKEREIETRTDGNPSVQIEIYKEGDANIVALAQRVKAAIGSADGPALPGPEDAEDAGDEQQEGDEERDEAEEDVKVAAAPGDGGFGLAGRIKQEEGARLATVADRSLFIESSINEVKITAILGGLLAILILYLFLRNFKSTFIVAVSIPISLLIAFAPLNLFGVSLNIMSLGGLALGIGMLVDSSIVVLESIYRCREEGDGIMGAADRGTSEVRGAVFASTLTSIAVFFPMVFVEGIAGQAFGDLGVAVVVSLLASAAVALLFIPMLASRGANTPTGERPKFSYFLSPRWIRLRDGFRGRGIVVKLVAWPVFVVAFVAGYWWHYVSLTWSELRRGVAEAPLWFKILNAHNWLIQLLVLPVLFFVVRGVLRLERGHVSTIGRIWAELRQDFANSPLWLKILASPFWLVRTIVALPLPHVLVPWPWPYLFASRSWEIVRSGFIKLKRASRLVTVFLVIPSLYLLLRVVLGALIEGLGQLVMALIRMIVFLFVRLLAPILAGAFLFVVWPFGKITDLLMRALTGIYPRILRSALAHPAVVVLIVGVCFWGTWSIVTGLDSELLPEVHQGEFTVEVALPVGTPIEETDRVVGPIEAAILEEKEHIRSLVLTVGYDSSNTQDSDEGEHTARFKVLLEESRDPKTTERIVTDRLRARFEGIPDLDARIERPVLFSSKTPIEVEVHGDDLRVLKDYADRAETIMARLPELADVETSLRRGAPEVQIVYDRDLLSLYELNVMQVASLVRNKVKGFEATRFNMKDRRIPIIVRLAMDDRETVDDVSGIIVNPGGERPIPLSAVATVTLGEGPSEVRRIDGRRVAVISANLAEGSLSQATWRIQDELRRGVEWPAQMTFLITGQNEEWETSRKSLWIALALSIFLVYVIMAAQFESLIHPLVIMITIPLALVGTVVTLKALGMNLSIVVFLGMIMLAGIVVNNAIVLVDYINTLRRRGTPREEAIITAGRVRLRPILMTTATTVLGLMPLALGMGDGAEIRRPMAIAVISGLISSTALTLVIIPSIYLMAERLKQRMFGGKEQPSEEPGASNVQTPVLES